MSKVKLSRGRRNNAKLHCNFGDLWINNERFLILDHEPISEKQRKQIHSEIQSRIGKDIHQSLIDWIIEDGKLFSFMDIDGVQEKVFVSWFNRKIRVLKKLKHYRKSTNNKTLYCREVIDLRFKKGLLIGTRTFTQEFEYEKSRYERSRCIGRPLTPLMRE